MQVRPGFLVFLMCVIWGFAQMANAQVGAETDTSQFQKEAQKKADDQKPCPTHLEIQGYVLGMTYTNGFGTPVRANDIPDQTEAQQCARELGAIVARVEAEAKAKQQEKQAHPFISLAKAKLLQVVSLISAAVAENSPIATKIQSLGTVDGPPSGDTDSEDAKPLCTDDNAVEGQPMKVCHPGGGGIRG